MVVSASQDTLNRLLSIRDNYAGSRHWNAPSGVFSNPVKEISFKRRPVEAHPNPRNTLSCRSGATLVFALQEQGVNLHAANQFSRIFLFRAGGRKVCIENGVLEDLLGIGAIANGSNNDIFSLTGLGVSALKACFPGTYA